MIQKEIRNLRYIFTKGKKDKAVRKPPKPKPIKEKLGPKENKVKTLPPEELLTVVSYIYNLTILNNSLSKTGFVGRW